MEWTDDGAQVSFRSNNPNQVIFCPVCGCDVKSGTEHRCGSALPSYKAISKQAGKPPERRANVMQRAVSKSRSRRPAASKP